MNVVIAGSWFIFGFDVLIVREIGVLNLVACIFGVLAIASVTVWRKRRRSLVVLAALVFLGAHSVNVVMWSIDGAAVPDFFGDTFVKRIWSFYAIGYSILEYRLEEGRIAEGVASFFSDTVMPLLQIALIVLLLRPESRSITDRPDQHDTKVA